MTPNVPDYRMILKSTLAGGDGRSSLSLRAFAQKVGLSNSYLSEILNGKKSLSIDLAFKIAVKLGMTDKETQYFCLLVQLEQATDPFFRDELLKRLRESNPERPGYDLSADLVQSIAEWYHAAILELSHVPGFQMTPEGVARALEISKIDAELAIDRLLRLELLERDKLGVLRKSHDYVFSEAHIPNVAFKKFHGEMLNKAYKAIYAQTPDERISATDVIALDPKHLKKVDKLSREFSAAVLNLADKSKVRSHVYALSTHFFRLTQTRKKP